MFLRQYGINLGWHDYWSAIEKPKFSEYVKRKRDEAHLI